MAVSVVTLNLECWLYGQMLDSSDWSFVSMTGSVCGLVSAPSSIWPTDSAAYNKFG